MARIARLVAPGFPHHLTQRGARKQQTFFSEQDYRLYLRLLASAKSEAGVEVWAYCLMPNHVHLVVVPETKDSLAKLCRRVHRVYARMINSREEWQGHLWQERFHSVVLDEEHLVAAVRYVELNPVRAGICGHPQNWPWSSIHSHLAGKDNDVVTVAPMLARIVDWSRFLSADESDTQLEFIRQRTKTGRPAGSGAFISELERVSGRELGHGKPGPKSRKKL